MRVSAEPLEVLESGDLKVKNQPQNISLNKIIKLEEGRPLRIIFILSN